MIRDPETGAAYEWVAPDPEPDVGDIMNWQLVGARGNAVTIMVPRASMSKGEALLHAAWIVVVAEVLDDDSPSFEDYLQAVRST